MLELDNREPDVKQTTVEEGTEFKGTLSSKCQVMVRGLVDGDLTAPSIVISETGTVTGNIKAKSIQSEGVLAGRVDADDIYLSGSVRSDTVIRAKTLEVKLQGKSKKFEITFGECILDVGEDPSIEAKEVVPTKAEAKGKNGARREEPVVTESAESKEAKPSDDNGSRVST
jgi:cytoskeletal protein CcmA (bactofilin family)